MKTAATIALVGVALGTEVYEFALPSSFRPYPLSLEGKRIAQFNDNEFFGLESMAENELSNLDYLKNLKERKVIGKESQVNKSFGTQKETQQKKDKVRRFFGKASRIFEKRQQPKKNPSTEFDDNELFDFSYHENELTNAEDGRKLHRENILELTKKILILKEELKKIDLDLVVESDNELIKLPKIKVKPHNLHKSFSNDMIDYYKRSVAFEGVDNALHSLGTLLNEGFEIEKWHEEREKKVQEINVNILMLKDLLKESEVTVEDLVNFFEDSEFFNFCYYVRGKKVCKN